MYSFNDIMIKINLLNKNGKKNFQVQTQNCNVTKLSKTITELHDF